jgi:hypothetical protein
MTALFPSDTNAIPKQIPVKEQFRDRELRASFKSLPDWSEGRLAQRGRRLHRRMRQLYG